MSAEYKLGIICYVPPRRVYPAVDSFLKNMKDFTPKHPLFMFSDEQYDGVIKIAASPEIAKVETNKMACNNLIFFIAIRIMASKGFTHVLLLENDCRVMCDGWDDVIWSEFQRKNSGATAGGSIVIFNPCSYGRRAAERYHQFLMETNATRPMPLSMTGSSNLAERRDCCVFPNGAFAIYRMDWLLKTFPEIIGKPEQYIELSKTCKTWDYEIAVRLWNEFKEGVYDRVVQIDSIYSGYGNVMSTEDERKELLTSGKVIGVHQIKSDWTPEKKSLLTPESKLEATVDSKVVGSVEIFLVTYARDFRYLKYCLRSIEKFAKGFSGVTILVPNQDVAELRKIIAINYHGEIPIRVKRGTEWVGKGFLWHMAQICRADEWCPKADFVAHLDPDCVFTAPCSPETFFKDGKPVLRYEPFESLAKREPNIWNWKIACDNALPFQVNDEGMRGHPEIYTRITYELTRQMVEEKTKMPFNEYVRSCKNSFPQSFAEFPTLSAVAKECCADSYCLHDCSRDENPDKSPWPVFQAWSNRAPDEPCELMIAGIKRIVKPLDIYVELGIQ